MNFQTVHRTDSKKVLSYTHILNIVSLFWDLSFSGGDPFSACSCSETKH